MRIKGFRGNSLLNFLFIFILGGCGYYLMEILYRGHSHWSMAVCGGICLLGIYFINHRFLRFHALFRAVLCALFITLVEFLAGCIVNLWLGLNVWSYTALPLNFMGQICFNFSILWFFLSLALCLLLSFFSKKKGATESLQN